MSGLRAVARFEGEVAARRRLGGEHRAVEQDDERAVEEFADLDGAAGQGATRRQLQPARAQAHGVIAGDDAPVATAEDEREVARRVAPGRGRGGGRLAKAAVEVGDERGQEGFGRRHTGDPAQAQLADQPILQRGPQPLDAALGLRRVGGDVADAEVLEHESEVRGVLRAGELFGKRPVRIVAHEEIKPIAVERQRQAVAREQLLKQRGVAVDVFGRAKVQGEDLRGGVVDGPEQHELGPPGLEPGEGAAIDLHERPALPEDIFM